MNREDFVKSMKHLEQYFGRNRFPQPALKALYNKVDHLTSSEFEEAIIKLFSNDYNPSLQEIVNVCNDKKPKFTKSLQPKRPQNYYPDCRKCGDSGEVTARVIHGAGKGCSFDFRCDCDLGFTTDNEATRWDEVRFGALYELEYKQPYSKEVCKGVLKLLQEKGYDYLVKLELRGEMETKALEALEND